MALAGNPQLWAGVITWYRGQLGDLEQLRRQMPHSPGTRDRAAARAGGHQAVRAQRTDDALLPQDAPVVPEFIQRSFAASFLPDERVGNVVQELQIVAYSRRRAAAALMRRRLEASDAVKTQVR